MPYTDKQRHADYQRNRRIKAKAKINRIKRKIGKCKVCGYSKHWQVLQFHHRKPEEKSFGMSDGNFANRKWEVVLNELAKCDCICANCHNWLHYQEKSFFIDCGKQAQL